MDNRSEEAEAADKAQAQLLESIESAKRLVEQTKFLLNGGADPAATD